MDDDRPPRTLPEAFVEGWFPLAPYGSADITAESLTKE